VEEYDPTRALTGIDYIHSMLMDNPDMFYITQGRQLVYVYLPEKGMCSVYHDFSGMTNEQVDSYLFYLKRGIT
jgi:hypothetical protein